ncbi:MAG: helix-turn-helix domain-containing protein [Actinomycetota bacterium]
MKTHSWEEIRAGDPDVNTPEYQAAYAQAGRDLELGARVRELRSAAGLTQTHLADLVGTRQPNIARIEAGGGTPRLETLQRIADALGVPFAVTLGPPPRRRRVAAPDAEAAFRRGIPMPGSGFAAARAKSASAAASAATKSIGKAASAKTPKAAPVRKRAAPSSERRPRA